MLKIFDRYVNIKNRDDLEDCTMELVEKLDQMLTEYGVEHAFSLASKEEIDTINDTGAEYCVTLMYEEKDEMTFSLVYTLWARVYRKAPDEKIRKVMSRMSKVKEAKCTNTAELQEELGVSRRTLRTDIAYLKRVYPDKLITHRGRYTGGLEWVE